MSVFSRQINVRICKGLIAALFLSASASSWAWGFGTDFSADNCTQNNSFVRCAMGHFLGTNVKDLPAGTPTIDPEALVAPNRPDYSGLERKVAAVAALADLSLGAQLFFGSMSGPSNFAEYLIVFVVMPMSVAGDRLPIEVAGDALFDGFKQLFKFTEYERFDRQNFTVKGGEICGDAGCRIGSAVFSNVKHADKLSGRYFDRAPTWMGIEGPIYVVKAAIPRIQKLGPEGSGSSVINQNVAIRLAEYLPNYFYIHLPSGDSKRPNIILNGGKVNHAIAPSQ